MQDQKYVDYARRKIHEIEELEAQSALHSSYVVHQQAIAEGILRTLPGSLSKPDQAIVYEYVGLIYLASGDQATAVEYFVRAAGSARSNSFIGSVGERYLNDSAVEESLGVAAKPRTKKLTKKKATIGTTATLFGLVAAGSLGGDVMSSPMHIDAPVSVPSQQQDVLSSSTKKPAVQTIKIEEEVVTEALPYLDTQRKDNTLLVADSYYAQQGVDGVKEIVYGVEYTDGEETGRTKLSETILKQPVDSVYVLGTKVIIGAPVEEREEVRATSKCDANYSGACVPIASDVDCEGGSGNGPAYVRGPVTVIGTDVYDLDRDNDGIGCEG